MLSENEIKCKALVIGQGLERMEWYRLSAPEASGWCIERAKEMGANNTEAEAIALLAMHYVIAAPGL